MRDRRKYLTARFLNSAWLVLSGGGGAEKDYFNSSTQPDALDDWAPPHVPHALWAGVGCVEATSGGLRELSFFRQRALACWEKAVAM